MEPEDDKKPATDTKPAKKEDKPSRYGEPGTSGGLYFEQAKDFAFAKNKYNGTQPGNPAAINNSYNFLSSPDSDLSSNNYNAGLMLVTTRDKSQTTFKLGAQLKEIKNTLDQQNVTVEQYFGTGLTPGGAPTGTMAATAQRGDVKQDDVLMSKLRLTGGAGEVQHRAAGLIMGARIGGGQLKSELNTDAYKLAVSGRNSAIDAKNIPVSVLRSEIAGTGGLTFGIDQGRFLPGVKVDADVIKSNSVQATNLGLMAFKDIPLGSSRVAITLQGGVNKRTTDIKYDANGSHNELHTNGGFSPNGQIGVKIGFGR